MNQVPDGVLRWLYNSLKPEYHDVERTYSDVADTLSHNTSLAPRTEVHTFENGASALLLLLQGTIPVQFRGAVYRYPLSIWIPHRYPHEPPLVYVNPTRDMATRPGQHVSVEGRVYHPYLANWSSRANESNIINLLSILANVFSKDPPVAAKHGITEPPQRTSSLNSGPPRLPRADHPNGLRRDDRYLSPLSSPSPNRPPAPPPPPKPAQTSDAVYAGGQRPNGVNARPGSPAPALPPKPGSPSGLPRTNGPPLPPLPHESQRRDSHQLYDQRSASYQDRPPGRSDNIWQQDPTPNQYLPQPPQPPSRHTFIQQHTTASQQQQQQYAVQHQPVRQPSPQQPLQHLQQPQYHQQQQQRQQQLHHHHPQPPQRPPQSAQQISKQPLPDLLSSPTSPTPPPPPQPTLPPNPEKRSLLTKISETLDRELSTAVAQNALALPALQAQQATMAAFSAELAAELTALQQLEAALSGNERILREALREAEAIEVRIAGREVMVPGVDEVLVAPSVVGEQLYGLVAEERGLAEGLFVLGRALERDRVSGEVFVKQTRSLAREQFLKKALIRKIAVGMGLTVGGAV